MRTFAATVLLVGCVLTGVGHSAPPAPSVASTAWQLDFDYQNPQSITLKLPGEDKPRTFWYVLYTLTNQTGGDRIFAPELTLYTDTGQMLNVNQSVPSSVFDAIQRRHNNPLLVSLSAMTGRILQGEDNARDSVAVWPDFDPEARAFDIFVGGLSGEKTVVKLPEPIKVTTYNDKDEPVEVTRDQIVLKKTLQLHYRIPGEAKARTNIHPQLVSSKWVMR